MEVANLWTRGEYAFSVRCYGVIVKQRSVQVIMKYMTHGRLSDFIEREHTFLEQREDIAKELVG